MIHTYFSPVASALDRHSCESRNPAPLHGLTIEKRKSLDPCFRRDDDEECHARMRVAALVASLSQAKLERAP
ncbi:hypothetical protein [Dyella sp. C11]|uniref:hypothetical protein n=1 Tax=Dyella sp. C11 TaxID=2126991 RepID=UPI00130082A1|nr:hypothetical protein [Dyella sp. C11]